MVSKKLSCLMIQAILIFLMFFPKETQACDRSFPGANSSSAVRSKEPEAGDSLSGIPSGTISIKALRKLNKTYAALGANIDRQSYKILGQLQKKENKLKEKLSAKDSAKSEQLFSNSSNKYQDLKNKLGEPFDNRLINPLKEYIPGLDSIQTATQFLQRNGINLPANKLRELQALTSQLRILQGKLQHANDIQGFIRLREQELKNQLGQYGLGKDLLGINKNVYYFQQQLGQYKTMINDQEKAKAILLDGLSRLTFFQQFMQKNSILAQMFPAPAASATSQTLAGLQTSSQVQSLINQKVGIITNGTTKAGQFLQQQVQAADSKLDELKNKMNQLGKSSGTTDMTVPDFKPDGQKTKNFLHRLVYGWNIQSGNATQYLPATTDLGFSIGYKINDNARAGVGSSYKIGLGSAWNRINLSSQGVGVRTFFDIKAKGGIWASGGFEYNYLQAFRSLQELHTNVNVWQKSALLGITKKFSFGKNKESNIQLLYDFLADCQIPRGQSLKFRVGYNF